MNGYMRLRGAWFAIGLACCLRLRERAAVAIEADNVVGRNWSVGLRRVG